MSIADYLSGTETYNAGAAALEDANAQTWGSGTADTWTTPSVSPDSSGWWSSALGAAAGIYDSFNKTQVQVAQSASQTSIAKSQAQAAATAAATPHGNAGAGVGVFGINSGASAAGMPVGTLLLAFGALALFLAFKQ